MDWGQRPSKGGVDEVGAGCPKIGLQSIAKLVDNRVESLPHRRLEVRSGVDVVVTRVADRTVEDQVGNALAQGLSTLGRHDLISLGGDDRYRHVARPESARGIELMLEKRADRQPGVHRLGDCLSESKGVTRISPSSLRSAARRAATPLPMLKPTATTRRGFTRAT